MKFHRRNFFFFLLFTSVVSFLFLLLVSDFGVINQRVPKLLPKYSKVLIVFSFGNGKCPHRLYQESYVNKYQYALINNYEVIFIKHEKYRNDIFSKISTAREIAQKQSSEGNYYEWILWTDPDVLIEDVMKDFQFDRYTNFKLVVWSSGLEQVYGTPYGLRASKSKTFLARNTESSWKYLEAFEKSIQLNQTSSEIYLEKSYSSYEYLEQNHEKNNSFVVEFTSCRFCGWQRKKTQF